MLRHPKYVQICSKSLKEAPGHQMELAELTVPENEGKRYFRPNSCYSKLFSFKLQNTFIIDVFKRNWWFLFLAGRETSKVKDPEIILCKRCLD